MQTESNPNTLSGGISPQRRKRIKRLKKMIVITIGLAILLPTVLCIFLGVQLFKVTRELEELKEQNAIIKTNPVEIKDEPVDSVSSETNQEGNTDEEDDKVPEPSVSTRKVYLTFDDGPSIYTEEILDILSTYGVKATFFVVGETDEAYAPMYKRIVEEGHSIGMHSYSHKYSEIYESLDSFKADYSKIKGLIQEKTGVECSIYRFPGGSSNSIGKKHMQEFISFLEEEGVVYYDWNISSEDATGVLVSVEDIVNNSTLELEKYNSAYILLHDSSTKKNTVDALPKIIETIQAMDNTEIVPITEDSVPVQQIIKE